MIIKPIELILIIKTIEPEEDARARATPKQITKLLVFK
jgi:hypothetical protein